LFCFLFPLFIEWGLHKGQAPEERCSSERKAASPDRHTRAPERCGRGSGHDRKKPDKALALTDAKGGNGCGLKRERS